MTKTSLFLAKAILLPLGQKSPVLRREFLVFLRFAGILGVRLEGFEPPTRGLGIRAGSFICVLGCAKIRLFKPNSHIWGWASFTVVSGGLVYQLV
jgi:hypothetical protein